MLFTVCEQKFESSANSRDVNYISSVIQNVFSVYPLVKEAPLLYLKSGLLVMVLYISSRCCSEITHGRPLRALEMLFIHNFPQLHMVFIVPRDICICILCISA